MGMDEPRKPEWLINAENELNARGMDEQDETSGYSIPASDLAPLLLAYNEVRAMGLDPAHVLRVIAAPRFVVPPQRGGGRPRTRGNDQVLKLYPRLLVLVAMAKVANKTEELGPAERERQMTEAARLALLELKEKHPALDLDWLKPTEIKEHVSWTVREHVAARHDGSAFHPRWVALMRAGIGKEVAANVYVSEVLAVLATRGRRDEMETIDIRREELKLAWRRKELKLAWRRIEQAFATHPVIKPSSNAPRHQTLPSPPPRKTYLPSTTYRALLDAGTAERKRMSSKKSGPANARKG
jgi:hypothetical protein